MSTKKIITSDNVNTKDFDLSTGELKLNPYLSNLFQNENGWGNSKVLNADILKSLGSSIFWGYYTEVDDNGQQVDPSPLYGFDTYVYFLSSINEELLRRIDVENHTFREGTKLPREHYIWADFKYSIDTIHYSHDTLNFVSSLLNSGKKFSEFTKEDYVKHHPLRGYSELHSEVLFDALSKSDVSNPLSIGDYATFTDHLVGIGDSIKRQFLFDAKPGNGGMSKMLVCDDARIMFIKALNQALNVIYKVGKNIPVNVSYYSSHNNEHLNSLFPEIKLAYQKLSKINDPYSLLEAITTALTEHSITPPIRDLQYSEEEWNSIKQKYLREEKILYDFVNALNIRLQNNTKRDSLDEF